MASMMAAAAAAAAVSNADAAAPAAAAAPPAAGNEQKFRDIISYLYQCMSKQQQERVSNALFSSISFPLFPFFFLPFPLK